MKIFNRLVRWLISPFTLGLAVTLAVLYVSFHYYDRYQNSEYAGESAFYDLLRETHQKSIDFRMVMRGAVPGHPDVAILAVDEASIEQEGRWPWPREKIGRIVEKTLDYGAKVIAFDIVFSEEDSNSSIPTLSRMKDVLAEKQALSPDLKNVFEHEIEAANSDRKFSEVLARRADHLVLGAYFEDMDKADYEKISPHADLCFDALHERSSAHRYWSRDQRRPVVTDNIARAHELPQAMKRSLHEYLSLLEGQALNGWLNQHEAESKAITQQLVKLGLPEEFPVPALLQPFLAGNQEGMKEAFSALTEQQPPPELMADISNVFSTVLSRKAQAVAAGEMRESTTNYCNRFLNQGQSLVLPNDELLDREAFKKIYEEPIWEQFDVLSWETVWQTANKKGEELPTGEFKAFLASLNKEVHRNQVSPLDRWWLNIPILEATTKYTGFFNAFVDTDGTIRRSMLIARRGNHYANSLSLNSFLIARNYSVAATILPSPTDETRMGIPIEFTSAPAGETSVRGPASKTTVPGFRILNSEGNLVMSVPVDPAGRMPINYSGPPHSFAHVSVADILSDSETMEVSFRNADPATGKVLPRKKVNKKEFLKNKILFFGATAIGIYDLRVTPFEENFPGVETHANMLSNLLVEEAKATGRAGEVKHLPGFLRTFPEREGPIMMASMLVGGLLLSALVAYLGSIAGLGVTIATLGGIYSLDRFVLFDSGIVVTIMLPIFLVASLFITLTFYKYFTEERTKRELKGTFEKYVSPAIVAEVLADPSNIELGGKKMELTVMFSDVRGFTTISEKLDPRALSDLLNSYLTPMTNLVFANKGTLDKYMGDAVMAFWGAPIHFKDHAKHAARCALQMIEKLKELQQQYLAQGLPEIDIGIGLNTGEMSVGNMGSDTVRSYTVMGDAVNLGSRLEGINKQYGTRIIVSEFTYAAIKDEFICREVDWVRVKGKAQPVRIFELVAEKKVAEQTQTLLETFQKGFEAYHTKEWDKAIELFTAALNIKPDDEPSQLYLERCHEYKAAPPDENWDGVFTMTTK